MVNPDDLVVEDRLYRQLESVNDWLKFAESKNAGMTGLSSGAIALFLTFLATADPILNPLESILLALGGVGLLGALLLTLTSFFPRTTAPKRAHTLRSPGEFDNLFYYGHVAELEPRGFAVEFAKRTLRRECEAVDLHHEAIAAQIVINAQITMRKLWNFRFAVVSFTVGMVLSTLGVVITLVQR